MRPIFSLAMTAEFFATLRADGRSDITTVDVIEHFFGPYVVDTGVHVSRSPNGRFGLALSRHAHELGIELLREHVPYTDGQGNETTTAQWRLIRP